MVSTVLFASMVSTVVLFSMVFTVLFTSMASTEVLFSMVSTVVLFSMVSTVVLIQIWLNVISAHTNPPTNHQPNNQSLFKLNHQTLAKWNEIHKNFYHTWSLASIKEFGCIKLQICERLQACWEEKEEVARFWQISTTVVWRGWLRMNKFAGFPIRYTGCFFYWSALKSVRLLNKSKKF